ncbi:MAG: isochorismate synthase [Candidatus Omnitrophica bacterium]|nr:isochorismate synthase [Candidatus Omnitrophota bacterium]
MKTLEPALYQRTEVEVEPQDLLAWLSTQSTTTKFYWSSRDGDFQVAASGVLHLIEGEKVPTKHLHPRMRYYGGFAFDPHQTTKEWDPFGKSFFFIPEFEIFVQQGKYHFAHNYISAQSEKYFESLSTRIKARGPQRISSVSERTDLPRKKDWEDNVRQAIEKFDDNFKKVVLARRSRICFDENPDPFDLMKALQIHAGSCFHFLFQKEGATFLGASPERLYRREKDNLFTEAIAGTRPRGETPQQDKQLIENLKKAQKDLYEQKLVADMIQQNLQECCTKIEKEKLASVLSLQTGHHLISRFEGRLKQNTHDQELLRRLHPTPAVAGWPKSQALEIIRSMEPFSRGWYAGPIGYLGQESSEFAVAIRSGLLYKNELYLYAGAGIVPGSDPQGEWDEVEQKLRLFLNLWS